MPGQQPRPARMAASYVQWGDIIMEAPSDGGRVIGTVMGVEGEPSAGYRFTVRTRTGSTVWPKHPKRPIMPERSVWVHVPAGRA
jgi:hypothetical protein